MQFFRAAYLITCALFIMGCSQGSKISTTSMLPPLTGEGPWQLVTYDNQRLEREVVEYDNGQVYATARAVYMNEFGKLVFKDGEPITTYDGHELYWNNKGRLLTSAGQFAKKSRLFSIAGKPVHDGRAIMFRDTLLKAKANLAKQVSGDTL